MKLSVVIPVYNGRKFLREAVLSALGEKKWDTEVIVIDDGSQDHGLETVADLDIQTVRLPQNFGPSRSRNEGIRRAKGDYIAFLDSDDILSAGSLDWRISYLESHRERMAVSGLVESLIDDDGKTIKEVKLTWDAESSEEILIESEFYQNGGSIGQPLATTLFRRELFQEIGYFDESLRLAEDIDLYLRAIAHAPIPLFFRPALQYRIHPGNTSKKYSVVPSARLIAAARLVFLSRGYRREFKEMSPNCFSIYQRASV